MLFSSPSQHYLLNFFGLLAQKLLWTFLCYQLKHFNQIFSKHPLQSIIRLSHWCFGLVFKLVYLRSYWNLVHNLFFYASSSLIWQVNIHFNRSFVLLIGVLVWWSDSSICVRIEISSPTYYFLLYQVSSNKYVSSMAIFG